MPTRSSRSPADSRHVQPFDGDGTGASALDPPVWRGSCRPGRSGPFCGGQLKVQDRFQIRPECRRLPRRKGSSSSVSHQTLRIVNALIANIVSVAAESDPHQTKPGTFQLPSYRPGSPGRDRVPGLAAFLFTAQRRRTWGRPRGTGPSRSAVPGIQRPCITGEHFSDSVPPRRQRQRHFPATCSSGDSHHPPSQSQEPPINPAIQTLRSRMR